VDRNAEAGQGSSQEGDRAKLTGRRKFLRQFGMTAAAAAAAVGVTELAGLTPAAAATRGKAATQPFRGTAPLKIVRSAANHAAAPDCDPIYGTCACDEGHCDGGHCPHGYVCNYCITECGDGFYCIKGGCREGFFSAVICSIC
jgi:hypothetical protein